MKIDTSIIQVLITKAKNLKHPSYLFSFDYNKLHFSCIYLVENSILLITARSTVTVSWSTCINTQTGYIDTFIPNECFNKISRYVLDNKKLNGFFTKIADKLKDISTAQDVVTSSSEEILDIIAKCTTKDNKVYEGERPFYYHYRRVNPSKENLHKIKPTMGFDIYNFCLKNNVTIVWTDTPKPNSLEYLNLDKFKNHILSNINK